MNLALLLILALAATVQAQICFSEWGSYSGLKFVYVDRLSVYPLGRTHELMIANCTRGKLVNTKSFDLGEQRNNVFRESFCFGEDPQPEERNNSPVFLPALSLLSKQLAQLNSSGLINYFHFIPTPQQKVTPVCYRLARRRVYAMLNLRVFVPHTFLGAVFQCSGEPGTCKSKDYTAAESLVADDPLRYWYSMETSRFSVVHYTPFMKTRPLTSSDTLKMEKVDINEHYQFSANEKALIQKAVRSTVRFTSGVSNLVLSATNSRTSTNTNFTTTLARFFHPYKLDLLRRMQKQWDELPF